MKRVCGNAGSYLIFFRITYAFKTLAIIFNEINIPYNGEEKTQGRLCYGLLLTCRKVKAYRSLSNLLQDCELYTHEDEYIHQVKREMSTLLV